MTISLCKIYLVWLYGNNAAMTKEYYYLIIIVEKEGDINLPDTEIYFESISFQIDCDIIVPL